MSTHMQLYQGRVKGNSSVLNGACYVQMLQWLWQQP